MTLARLRADPGRAGVEGTRAEIAKLERLRGFRLPHDLFEDVAPKVLKAYRSGAASESPNSLRAHSPPVRYTLLAALCFMRELKVTDGLVEVLLQIVRNIGVRSERKVERVLLRNFKRISGKSGILFRMAEAALENPDGLVREVFFPVVDEATLDNLVKEAKSTGDAYRARVQFRDMRRPRGAPQSPLGYRTKGRMRRVPAAHINTKNRASRCVDKYFAPIICLCGTVVAWRL